MIDYHFFFDYNLVMIEEDMKMKFKRNRRLNNKGFTLIELLAVIVILAIVMGISATNVLNSINQSRKSSLLSTAQNAANTLNTWISEDMIQTDNSKKKLGDDFITKSQQDSNWHCLSEFTSIINAGKSASLVNALSLNEKDLVIVNGKGVPTTSNNVTQAPTVTGIASTSTCSALRYNSSTGGYEILLVAVNGGKYYVSSNGYATYNYAFSRASEAGTKITD